MATEEPKDVHNSEMANYGWPEFAPYDAIHVGAAAAEIPQPLIDQLKTSGRMMIPVGNLFQDWQNGDSSYKPFTGFEGSGQEA